jgi:hypothetical protein
MLQMLDLCEYDTALSTNFLMDLEIPLIVDLLSG